MDLRSERPGETWDVRDATAQRERRLEQLIDRLPKSWRSTARWLRQPSQRWLRICAGVLLIIGSLFSILPCSRCGCSRSAWCCWPKTYQCCGDDSIAFWNGSNGVDLT